ncbi:hypothetical protein TNIN_350301 [Trichonephila inaurata madagascariensis]|uniref:Uncharacterized protein n=1 Tax=Trichonephila inaurata madagascariensis TaxID=2747483 RepID=A0A8X6YSI9_9ARAC|nr:hypothetical protein TNIN_350301 [Trichonephila inaurata madagascariensis]
MLGRGQLPSTKSNSPRSNSDSLNPPQGPSASTPGPSLLGPPGLVPDRRSSVRTSHSHAVEVRRTTPPASGRDPRSISPSVQYNARSSPTLIDQVRAGPSLLGPIGLVPDRRSSVPSASSRN